MTGFWYKSFKLADFEIKPEGFYCFKLSNSNDYILEGCTKDTNWQEYAQTVVDNYYEWLDEESSNYF